MRLKERNRRFRGYLIDHHLPGYPVVTLNKLDMNEYEQAIKKARIDNLLVYCKDHWGMAYYDTMVGKRHPALKFDYVAEQKKILKKNGIEFVAYYSAGYDTHIATIHPDWALKDDHGSIRRAYTDPPAQWHWVCINTPYREYMMRQLEEIVTGYEPDAVFLDIVAFPVCYCDYCREFFKKLYNRDIPADKEKCEKWRMLVEYRHDRLLFPFFKEVVEKIKKWRTQTAVTINGGYMHFPQKILSLFDYVFGEVWAGTYYSAAFARDVREHSQLGSGDVSKVFDPPVREHFLVSVADILAQGCRALLFSQPQHIDGRLDALEFENTGEAYKEVEKFEEHLVNRKPIRCIGLIYSEDSRIWDRDPKPVDDPWQKNSLHVESLAGAIQVTDYSKYPFEVISEWRLIKEGLSGFDILVLPEVSCISERMAMMVQDFVHNGGILISSMNSGIKNERGDKRSNFILADVFGCDYIRENREFISNIWGSYLNRFPFQVWNNLPATELVVSPPLIEVKPRHGTDVWATHILPSVKLGPDTWINWNPPHPGEVTNLPAIVYHVFGKGKAVYLSFDPFTMHRKDFHWPKVFFREILEFLLPDVPVRLITENPHVLKVTHYQTNNKQSLIIHQINHSIELLGEEHIPVDGGRLIVDAGFFLPAEAYTVYPENHKLLIKQTGSRYSIELPDVDLHTIIKVDASKK